MHQKNESLADTKYDCRRN